MTIASTAANVDSAANARSRHASRSATNDSGDSCTVSTFHSGRSNIPAVCDSLNGKFALTVATLALATTACGGSGGTSWDDYCARVDGDERITAAIAVIAAEPGGLDYLDAFDNARRGLAAVGAEGGVPDELADHYDVLAAGQTAEGASGSDTTEAVVTITVETADRC